MSSVLRHFLQSLIQIQIRIYASHCLLSGYEQRQIYRPFHSNICFSIYSCKALLYTTYIRFSHKMKSLRHVGLIVQQLDKWWNLCSYQMLFFFHCVSVVVPKCSGCSVLENWYLSFIFNAQPQKKGGSPFTTLPLRCLHWMTPDTWSTIHMNGHHVIPYFSCSGHCRRTAQLSAAFLGDADRQGFQLPDPC